MGHLDDHMARDDPRGQGNLAPGHVSLNAFCNKLAGADSISRSVAIDSPAAIEAVNGTPRGGRVSCAAMRI
jgi:hypothetical protein